MAVIPAFLSPSEITLLDEVNPNITTDIENLSGPTPFQVNDSGNLVVGPITTHWPVEANGVNKNGFICDGYVEDFYNRIHVIPSKLELGNIISNQTTPVKVWNAYFRQQLLLNIINLQEGLELSGQPPTPLTFKILEELEFNVGVTTEGPAVLDVEIIFQFSSGGVGTLAITGNRISAFAWRVDWSSPIREKLIWATSVVQSPTGKEQRRSLRVSPNRELSAAVILDKRERQAFDITMFGWGSRVFAIPVWHDVQSTIANTAIGATTVSCDTVNRDFRVGGLAMFVGETAFQFETVEILSFTTSQLVLKRPTLQQWPAGTALYPVRTASLINAPQITRKNHEIQITRVDFEMMEPCDWPALMPATMYRGWPVFDAFPDETEDLTSQFQNLLLRLDNGSAMPRISDTADLSFFINLFRWCLLGRAEHAQHRSLMYALAGRSKAVWISTHADDLTLVAIVAINNTLIDVAAINYTRFGQAKIGRRDIRIQLRNGTVYYRRIVASTEVSASVERLQLDSGFTVQINPTDVARISWLSLMRGDSDSIEIEHINDTDGSGRSQQIFRSVADEL